MYTHYWRLSSAPRGQAQRCEERWQHALREAATVVRHIYTEEGISLSGFTAHTEPGRYGGLLVNGKGHDGHEDLCLREHYRDAVGFGFCKTARKPYDLAVTAVLAVLQHHLGDLIAVSSDGDAVDWMPGVEMARKVLGYYIPNPVPADGALRIV